MADPRPSPFDRLRSWYTTFRQWQRIRSTRLRRIIMGVAVLFLIGGIVLSLRQQPDLLSQLNWRPALLLVVVGIPLTAWLNAVEFQLSGRLVGASLSLRRSLEVVIIASAANMLPLPGSTLVRVSGLKTAGVGIKDSTAATFLIAAIWLGVAFVCAGAGVIVAGSHWLGGSFLGIGTMTWIAAMVAGTRMTGGFWVMVYVSLAKLALSIVDVFRIFLCFQALGVDATVFQSACFAITGVVGSAASIVPAGLGVREAVSAALAPVIGLAAASAFLAATLNRLLGLLFTLPVAMALTFK